MDRSAFALGAASMACFAGVLLTRERGSTLALIMAVAVTIACQPDKDWVRRVSLAGAIITLPAIFLLQQQILSALSRGQSARGLESLSGRNQIFAEAYRLFLEHPVVGMGYLSGRSVFLPKISWAGESHNVLVEILVSSGVVGLVAWGVVFFRWQRRIWWTLRRAHHVRDWATESMALVCLVLVAGATADSFAGPPRLTAAALVLALVLAEAAEPVSGVLNAETDGPTRLPV